VHGVSTNGRRRDDWGNWYGNGDGKWLRHYSFDPAYLRAGLEERLVTPLGNYGDAGNVYPGKKQMPVAGIGAFSAYRDELFGTDFATSVFICERAARILHREVLAQDGISFLSRRAHDEQRSEFLEGGEFVSVKTAPDGTLAVVDSEQGIYRVFPSDKKPRPVPDLAAMRDGELADALHSPSGWQRDTVERLLIEREAKGATGAIRRIVRLGKIPQARLQALATLDALHTLEPDDVRAALRDRHYAPIRTQAVRLAEQFGGDAALLEDLAPFTEDPDMCVRRQLALSVRRWRGPQALSILRTLAYKIPGQPDLRAAVLGSLGENDPLAREIREGIKPPPPPPKFTSDERAKIAGEFASAGALKGDAARGLAVFKKHCADCHRSGDVGASVGPEIPQGKPLDWMLMAILDPGASVEARYLENKITLKDGSAHTGVVIGETKDGVTLRLAGGGEETLRRNEMTSQQAPGKSLMPDDFSTKLRPQDIADIRAWLGR
jgi:putative heme-binding domain-containing protein